MAAAGLAIGLSLVATAQGAEAERWVAVDVPDSLAKATIVGLGTLRFPDGRQGLWVGSDRGSYRRVDGRWAPWPDTLTAVGAVHDVLIGPDEQGRTTWWLAAEQGLYRSPDGHDWQSLSFAGAGTANTRPLVLLLDQDREGSPRIWVGSSAGLAVWRLGVWEIMPARGDGFHGGPISVLLSRETPEGVDIWAGGAEGLSRYRDGLWDRPGRACLRTAAISGLLALADSALAVASDQGLFVLAEDGGCRRLALVGDNARPVYGLSRDAFDQIHAFVDGGVARRDDSGWMADAAVDWALFDARDGLPASQVWTGASLLAANDDLLVGSQTGLWRLRSVLPPAARVSWQIQFGSDRAEADSARFRVAGDSARIELITLDSPRPHAIRLRALGVVGRANGDWSIEPALVFSGLRPGRQTVSFEALDEWGRRHGPFDVTFTQAHPAGRSGFLALGLALVGLLLGLAFALARRRSSRGTV